MKYKRKKMYKLSDTAAYLYIVGVLLWLREHIIELLILTAIIAIICVGQMFDSNVITFKTAIFSILILGIVLVTLIIIMVQGDEE